MLSIVTPALNHPAEGLTVRQCSHLLGRSASWVRDRIQSGALQADRQSGRYVVSAASLERLIEYLRSRRQPEPGRPTPAPHLRLVVDNTQHLR